MGLRHFSENEIILSQDEAWQILVFFFGGNAGIEAASLDVKDREFAQALLYEGIKASNQMAYALTLLNSTVNPSTTVKSIMKKLAKEAWTQFKKPRDKDNPKIYNSVKDTITRNWRSVWHIRTQTGELDF